jgi:hypothetical protein
MTARTLARVERTVAVDAAGLRDFRALAGWPDDRDEVPLSFAALWLGQEEIRSALADLSAEIGAPPLHEAQQIRGNAPLRVGARYRLTVALDYLGSARAVITATVADEAGDAIAELTAHLRFLHPPGGTAR